MAGAPVQKVFTGQRTRGFPAQFYNQLVHAVAHDESGAGAEAEPPWLREAGVIEVWNKTGLDLDEFSVVEIQQPLIEPSANETAFKERVDVRGITPTQAGKFAILIDPCPAESIEGGAVKKIGIARAVVSGVSPVRLYVPDALHEFAEAIVGDVTRLKSAAGGTARILWAEATGTERWAVVRFPDPDSPASLGVVYCPGLGDLPEECQFLGAPVTIINAPVTIQYFYNTSVTVNVTNVYNNNTYITNIYNTIIQPPKKKGCCKPCPCPKPPKPPKQPKPPWQPPGHGIPPIIGWPPWVLPPFIPRPHLPGMPWQPVIPGPGMPPFIGPGILPKPGMPWMPGNPHVPGAPEPPGFLDPDLPPGFDLEPFPDLPIPIARPEPGLVDVPLGKYPLGLSRPARVIDLGTEATGTLNLATQAMGTLPSASLPTGALIWQQATKTFSDFSTAATTNTIDLYDLPAAGVLHAVKVKHSDNFAGGAISQYTIEVGGPGMSPNWFGATPFSVFTAESATNMAFHNSTAVLPYQLNHTSATTLRVRATSSGANLNAATQGSVDIWLLISVAD